MYKLITKSTFSSCSSTKSAQQFFTTVKRNNSKQANNDKENAKRTDFDTCLQQEVANNYSTT